MDGNRVGLGSLVYKREVLALEDLVVSVFCIVMGIYVIAKNRKVVRELSFLQLVFALFSFLTAVGIAFVSIYYGGNWIAGQFSNPAVRFIVFALIVLLTLSLWSWILRKMLHKITNGVLPGKG